MRIRLDTKKKTLHIEGEPRKLQAFAQWLKDTAGSSNARHHVFNNLDAPHGAGVVAIFVEIRPTLAPPTSSAQQLGAGTERSQIERERPATAAKEPPAGSKSV